MKQPRAVSRGDQKAISVGYELLTLQHAVEAAAALVEAGSADLDGRAEHQVLAVLALVGCRLRDLGRAVGGHLDPAVLWAPHNAALDGIRGGEDRDVVLPPSPDRARGSARQK
ncbi:hypothetical protein [Anaeromyxobacter paludicola]|uniref:hypothetical protein n=1 Tax=Anaeromyxobacter paludicola TaxID=2918171 RepID=UPI0020BE4015|nr:hypothetical protein [Anaeromyxobacter paludicola]